MPDADDVDWTSEQQEETQRRFEESGLAAQINESIQNPGRRVRLKRPPRRAQSAEAP